MRIDHKGQTPGWSFFGFICSCNLLMETVVGKGKNTAGASFTQRGTQPKMFPLLFTGLRKHNHRVFCLFGLLLLEFFLLFVWKRPNLC